MKILLHLYFSLPAPIPLNPSPWSIANNWYFVIYFIMYACRSYTYLYTFFPTWWRSYCISFFYNCFLPCLIYLIILVAHWILLIILFVHALCSLKSVVNILNWSNPKTFTASSFFICAHTGTDIILPTALWSGCCHYLGWDLEMCLYNILSIY